MTEYCAAGERCLDFDRRLGVAAETDRQLMERYGRLAESWISIAGLVNHRERGEA